MLGDVLQINFQQMREPNRQTDEKKEKVESYWTDRESSKSS